MAVAPNGCTRRIVGFFPEICRNLAGFLDCRGLAGFESGGYGLSRAGTGLGAAWLVAQRGHHAPPEGLDGRGILCKAVGEHERPRAIELSLP